MKIVRARDYDDMSRKVANIISAQVILKPDCVLGLATGSTPIGAYKQLAEWNKKGDCDFSQVSTYNLDEYRGLSHDDPQSYHYFMKTNFFDHVNIDQSRTHVPDGSNPDARPRARSTTASWPRPGIPTCSSWALATTGTSALTSPMITRDLVGTHCVDLTESTIQANSRLFDRIEDVPRQAYTMGVQTIMFAKMIVIAANGRAKAQAVYDMCYGPVTRAARPRSCSSTTTLWWLPTRRRSRSAPTRRLVAALTGAYSGW